MLSGHFFDVFYNKTRVFIIFIYFLDELSNFRNTILINQKQKMVIINCQWNCIQATVLKEKSSDYSLRKKEEEKDRIIFKFSLIP